MAEGLRILGVDPGSICTGWGLVGGSAERPVLLDCGVVRLPARRPFADRLCFLRREFDALLVRLRPTEAAVESPFHGANARAALQLAHARGVVLAGLGGAGVPVSEYAPATVKKSVVGVGKAEKTQVQAMVRRMLGSEAEPSGSLDATDALAVALCHLSGRGLAEAIARASRPRRARMV